MSTGSWYHRVLDGYRVGAHAGVALGGDLYDAEQLPSSRRVQLKIIAPTVAAASGFAARHEHDVALLSSFSHPHVMTLLGAGRADGATYMASKPLAGRTLSELILVYGRLDHVRVTELVAQLAAALDAAHERGLVHRGLSPSSIVVGTHDGLEHATITDFAVADDPALYRGLFARPSGTAPPPADYAAPEQIRGDAADARSDVYALGAIIFHALTGRTPFADRPLVAKLEAHLSEPVPSAAELVDDLPSGFDELLARALAKDPADRFESASELALALPDQARVRAVGLAMLPATDVVEDAGAIEDAELIEDAVVVEVEPPEPAGEPAVAEQPDAYVVPEEEDFDVLGDEEPLAPIDDGPYDEDLDDDELYEEAWEPAPSPAATQESRGRAPKADPDDELVRAAKPVARLSRPALIAVLVLLLAAIGGTLLAAGVFEQADEPDTSSGSTPPTAAAPPETTTTPPADSSPLPSDDEAVPGTTTGATTGWPEGRSAYTTVIYASSSDRAAALAKAREAAGLGVSAGVLRSDDFANLERGVWVAFAGVHESQAQAERTAQRMREAGLASSPYTRLIDPR